MRLPRRRAGSRRSRNRESDHERQRRTASAHERDNARRTQGFRRGTHDPGSLSNRGKLNLAEENASARPCEQLARQVAKTDDELLAAVQRCDSERGGNEVGKPHRQVCSDRRRSRRQVEGGEAMNVTGGGPIRRSSTVGTEDEEHVEQKLAEHDRNTQPRQRESAANQHRAHSE